MYGLQNFQMQPNFCKSRTGRESGISVHSGRKTDGGTGCWPLKNGTAYWIAAGGFITEGYLTDAIREVLLKDCQAASFDLKEQLHVLQLPEQKNIWDLSVGAYLINPLKNGYTYDDISTNIWAG